MSLVYIITNKINGKQYIGITSQPIHTRWINHISSSKRNTTRIHLHAALRKYGHENFHQELLYESDSYDHILRMEQYFIELYDTYTSGYNMTLGGEGIVGYTHTQQTRQKISESNKGQLVSKYQRECISRANKGKIHTQETRDKMSKSRTGKPLSSKHKESISKSHTGMKASKESIQNQRESRIKYMYIIYHPDGTITQTRFASDFCKKYNINKSYFHKKCILNEHIFNILLMHSAKGFKPTKELI